MMLKKIRKGLYKVYRQTHSTSNHHGTGNNKTYRDWYFVKARGDSLKGTLHVTSLSTPEDLVGKTIEIYVKVKNVKSQKN